MKPKLYDVVKKLLVEYPVLRDNDKMLMWYVWEKQHVAGAAIMQMERFVYDATTPESITRARRKVQENHPELGASEKVKAARDAKELQKGTHIFREEV